MRINRERTAALPFDLFMLLASVLSMVLIFFELAAQPTGEVADVINRIDLLLCAVFFIDFMLRLTFAKDRRAYLRWGWIDLVSSIPAVGALRAGRLFRIIRVLRILRSYRSLKLIWPLLAKQRANSSLASAFSITLLAVTFSSIAILVVERDPASNITTGADAVWWSIVTMSTVGYGDHFPVTTEGRIIAGVLILVGISMFGTLSGYFAAWFIEPAQDNETEMTREIRAQLTAIAETLERMEHRMGRAE